MMRSGLRWFTTQKLFYDLMAMKTIGLDEVSIDQLTRQDTIDFLTPRHQLYLKGKAYPLSEHALTLAVLNDHDQIVATGSLIFPNDQGFLPAVSTFAEVRQLIENGRVVEIGALATATVGSTKQCLSLMRQLAIKALELGLDYIVIVVSPDHGVRYKRIFSLDYVTGSPEIRQHTDDEPAVCLVYDLKNDPGHWADKLQLGQGVG